MSGSRRLEHVRSLLILALAASTGGCSLVFPVPDANEPPDASTTGHGGADAGAAVLTCAQTGQGPELVPAGARLCIDATPVTRDQYAKFVAANLPLDDQMVGCQGNTSWVQMGLLDAGSSPVDGVDWCDAWSYCAWAGKTLCGSFPGVTLPEGGYDDAGNFSHGLSAAGLSVDDRDASATAWACEGGDAGLTYPYGNDDDPSQCFSMGFFSGHAPPGPVMSKGCEGGFPGIYDMVGIYQWIDDCTGEVCSVVGGSECRGAMGFSPLLEYYTAVDYGFVGFRCCGVAPPTR
jgi:hypothetical protein